MCCGWVLFLRSGSDEEPTVEEPPIVPKFVVFSSKLKMDGVAVEVKWRSPYNSLFAWLECSYCTQQHSVAVPSPLVVDAP